MKLRNYLVAYLLLTSLLLQAQPEITAAEIQSNIDALASGNSVFRTVDRRFKGIVGTMMVSEEFHPGIIYMDKGQIVKHDQINYDAFNDELVIDKNGKEMVVKTLMVKSFTLYLADDTLNLVRQVWDGKIGFLASLYDGTKLSLLKKFKKIFVEPNNEGTGSYSVGNKNPRFEDSNKLAVLVKGKLPVEFKNKKTLLAVLPEYKDPIEEYAKQNKVDFKDESDLVLLLKYLDKK